MQRDELDAYLNQCLEVPKFRDYCPNGLQVEGRADVRRIVSGVTASLAFLEAAAAAGAAAVLVHHGYLWSGEDARLAACRTPEPDRLLARDAVASRSPLRMTSICLQFICRSTRIPSSAITSSRRPATTLSNVSGCRRWVSISPAASGSSTGSSTSRIRSKTLTGPGVLAQVAVR